MVQGYAHWAVDKVNRDGFGALVHSAKRRSYRELHRRTLSRWIAFRLARSEDADVRLLGRALSRTLLREFSRRERRYLAAIDDARAALNGSDGTIRSWGARTAHRRPREVPAAYRTTVVFARPGAPA